MSDKSNLAIGTGLGLGIGGFVGVKAGGATQAALALPYYEPARGVSLGTDEFVKAQENYIEQKTKEALEWGKIKEVTQDYTDKLKNGFERMVKRLPEVEAEAKSLKIKLTFVFAVLGALVGLLAAISHNRSKEELE